MARTGIVSGRADSRAKSLAVFGNDAK